MDDFPEVMAKRKTNLGTDSLPFRKILREIMKERNITIRQMADLAGVKASVIQNWTEGRNPHDLKAVARLAHNLGISFKALLLGEQETTQEGHLAGFFEEQSLFDGICKVSIKRLVRGKK